MNSDHRDKPQTQVRVRITGDFTRTEYQDFTIYADVSPPPDADLEADAFDEWCTVLDDEVRKVMPKGWRIRDWDWEIDR